MKLQNTRLGQEEMNTQLSGAKICHYIAGSLNGGQGPFFADQIRP